VNRARIIDRVRDVLSRTAGWVTTGAVAQRCGCTSRHASKMLHRPEREGVVEHRQEATMGATSAHESQGREWRRAT
jgi:Mn-dependent DtxR family transcriptional regulator